MSEALQEIQKFWDAASKSEKDQQGLKPTARDPYLQEAIEQMILPILGSKDTILDVGCGDGSSSILFAGRSKSVTGVDYIEGFVAKARENAAAASSRNTEFDTGDVLDLSSVRKGGRTFDKVISIRCLINLPTLKDQRKGIEEIAKCVKPGGHYICSEGWTEGMSALNELRASSGLGEIPVAKYNLLISRKDFEEATRPYFTVESYLGLGTYLLVSRILHPLLAAPNPPRHDSAINRIAKDLQLASSQLVNSDKIDYAGLYVLRRNAKDVS